MLYIVTFDGPQSLTISHARSESIWSELQSRYNFPCFNSESDFILRKYTPTPTTAPA